MMYADRSRGRPFAKDPAVVRFRDCYWLYYSVSPYRDGRTPDGWGIGVAVSTDLEGWTKVGEIEPAQSCERNGLCAPGAIVLGDQVHLFYQTYGNGRHDAICHAVSADGVSFARDPGNPIFRPAGTWTCGRAIDADVVAHGDELLLYFATRDPAMKVQMLGIASAPLGSDFGPSAWTQRGEGPILRPELPWEQDCIEAPAVCAHDGRLFMFYGGAYNNAPQQIGCAESLDGLRWTRLADQPLVPNGPPGSWNHSESGHPFVFVDHDGRTHLFLQGNATHGQDWFLSRLDVRWEDGRPRCLLRPDVSTLRR